MAKRKYSEVEMIGALKQLEAGRTAAELGPGTGSIQAHGVCVEGQVWGDERGGSATAAAVGG